MSRKTACYETTFDPETGIVHTAYSDGHDTDRDTEMLSDVIQRTLLLHGLKQKLGDSTAGYKGVLEDAGPEQALIWCQDNHDRVWGSLMAGEWTSRGEGQIRVTDLMQAVARVYGESLDVVIAKIGPMSKEEKEALKEVPLIQEALLTVRAERAARKASEATEAAKEAGELPDLF